MKAKKFLMLLAAVLLSSVSAFAQSGGDEPLKGDVNDDGKVDVADIAAVIQIMKDGGSTDTQNYWYVGHVTNAEFENPAALASIVKTKGTPTTDTTGPSKLAMPSTTGDVLVFIYPTVWGTPNITDHTGYGTGDGDYLEDCGLTPPSGYSIRYWSGNSLVCGNTLNVSWAKTYYFSVGTTQVTSSNYTTANNATTTIPTTTTYSSTQRNYHYILIPSSKTITIVDVNLNNAPINITEQTSIIIPNHKVYKTVGPLNVGGTVRITLE